VLLSFAQFEREVTGDSSGIKSLHPSAKGRTTGRGRCSADLESRVRKDHPLRTIRAIVNEALGAVEREILSLYSATGRPSIAPERRLRAMLLLAFYSIRSERQLMEGIEFDLLFRWFVSDDPAWDH
jgi:transposase